MAKLRMINTRFWIDDYISNLDPIEKLLFLYFITNPATDICGIYELPLKNVALDTGIDKEMVIKIVKRFTKDKRIMYINGWVIVVNFIKHQAMNPSVEQGVKNGLAKAPPEILDKVSQAVPSLSHLNLNLNPNLNLKNVAQEAPDGETPKKGKEKRTAKPIVMSEYLKTMDENPREHIQLISYYFRKRKVQFDTDFEVEEAISRHSRAAVKVIKFGKEKVFKAVDECELMHKTKGIEWTLETCWKLLTK